MWGFQQEYRERNHKDEGEEASSITQLLPTREAVLPQTRHVELFIVIDKERYDMMGRNQTAVREDMIHLANYLDSMYIMLNIRIVLVGLEIWTNGNLINIIGGAGDVLGNFVQWWENFLITCRRHDSAQPILKKGFGGMAGMAFVGTVCSGSHPGGINVFRQIVVETFASTVAHELGHNLGMNHDDGRDCLCEAKSCIMNSGASGSRNFSSCSAEDFEKLTLNRGGNCLLNIPKPDEAYSTPFCSNKVVDAGEQCDCGTPKECELDPCCEGSTCKLKSFAECAYDFQLRSDVPDPGMVNEGTRCDDGKICRNFQCVDASVLNYDVIFKKSVMDMGRDQIQKMYFRKKRSQTYESVAKIKQKFLDSQPVNVPRHVSPVTPPRELPTPANRFPVPTYAAKQPQQFPSKTSPPQPKASIVSGKLNSCLPCSCASSRQFMCLMFLPFLLWISSRN
ncbi:hypothetical protein MC885_013998 [Smutsia gigantea]|nr:hypothetical protein MC885_013998 [Smutsia gigantea]